MSQTRNMAPAARTPPGRILVIHTAFLGDLVLATAFLANLRALAPRAEIRFVTTPAGTKLLTPNEFDIRPETYDKRGRDAGFGGFVRVARRLRAFRPELVFCLHRSFRSALLAKLSGGEVYGFREAAGSALFRHRVVRPAGLYEAEKNQRVLEAWSGVAGQSVFPRLSATREEFAEAEKLLGPGDFLALAPSSVWATKRWPPEHFARLAELFWEKYRLRAVMVGGSDPVDLGASAGVLAAFRGQGPAPLDLVGKTGLGTLKSVLSRAKLVVANDSAPLHVAIAMGAPVVGVFGPTTRKLGFFPNAPAGMAGVAELAGLACRPCGLHGHDRCPLGHFRCMLTLMPESVFAEAEKIYSSCR